MPFTSYAQNFEDVMLWRALKHVGNGCYVDVGAQHPSIDSVSKAFYERGWRGIHIEPVAEYAALLRQERPDESVLEIALSDTDGMLELNIIPETGLSTAIDAYAQHHNKSGLTCQRLQVPTLTLKSALQELAGKPVHWLKIDVEGLEEQVLNGWDSQTLRPWIMVVEATIPNSAQTGHTDWEPILTGAAYQFVYFDGLNRFYIAQEHAGLAAAFNAPPNVFDDIRLTIHSSLCQEMTTQIVHSKTQAAQAEARAAQAEARTAAAEAYVQALLHSHSWRITRPLRFATERWQQLRQRYSGLRAGLLSGRRTAASGRRPPLSPRSARIHAELKQAIQAEQNAGKNHAHRD